MLIVTYYWPPSGGSGVQRWLKFVKYLPQFGWQPFVFTPENPAFDIKDPSLAKDVTDDAEVIHFPIWEPYDAFLKLSRLLGSRRAAKPTDLVSTRRKSMFERFSTWVRGNLFIPDARMFWVKPSVKFLQEFLAANKIGTIITTGPPHSVHLIGLKLKDKNPSLRWIADFRDPWSEWGLLDSLNVGRLARGRHRRLEQAVLTTADDVITITPFYARRFETLGNRSIHLLTNGFDEDDFANLERVRPPRFVIRHAGIVNEKCDPRPLMEALLQLADAVPDFARQADVEFVGEVHPQFRDYVMASPVLKNITRFTGNIPHRELLKLYGSSSLLVLVLNGYRDAAGYMPGKMFEYLATGVPVLGVGPVDGDAAAVLKQSAAGDMIAGTDIAGIRNNVLRHFEAWRTAQPFVKGSAVLNYSRKAITARLADLLSLR